MKSLKKSNHLNKQQQLFISYYLTPESPTFANAYKSALEAGYKEEYAQNITHLNPKWLSETIGQTSLEYKHIIQTIQELASFNRKIESKSPDDTRLKALELLSKLQGHLIERKQIAQVVKVELGQVNSEINKS